MHFVGEFAELRLAKLLMGGGFSTVKTPGAAGYCAVTLVDAWLSAKGWVEGSRSSKVLFFWSFSPCTCQRNERAALSLICALCSFLDISEVASRLTLLVLVLRIQNSTSISLKRTRSAAHTLFLSLQEANVVANSCVLLRLFLASY